MSTNNEPVTSNKHQVEALIIDIENKIEKVKLDGSFSGRCIYRVPKILRDVRETAYTPQIISIGPFHYNNNKLAVMEEHKWRYLSDFMLRVAPTGKTMNDLVECIQPKEDNIKRCYDETIQISGEKFIKMILLDSVFIIELLLKEHYGGPTDFKPWLRNAIELDLMLLENQLPFFILKGLYDCVFADESNYPHFNDLVGEYFSNFTEPENRKCSCGCCFPDDKCTCKNDCPHLKNHHHHNRLRKFCSCDCCWSWLYCFWITSCFSASKTNEIEKPDPKSLHPKHFTDFVRLFRSWNHPKEVGNPIENVFSASKLHEAGVKFKESPEAWPLNITFENGALKLPLFEVYDQTESLIRNLMAFEQCHYPQEAYICNYIKLMDFLVNSEKDVDLLVEQGIIVNWLGRNDKVSKMVNDLNLQIVETGSCYDKLGERLNEHYGNWWYSSVATMRSVYFTNLWKGTGTIVGLAVLFFSIIQSVRSLTQMFS